MIQMNFTIFYSNMQKATIVSSVIFPATVIKEVLAMIFIYGYQSLNFFRYFFNRTIMLYKFPDNFFIFCYLIHDRIAGL